MFRRLHRAYFFIEPTERPGAILDDFCGDFGAPENQFDVQVRQILPPPGPPAANQAGSAVKEEMKDEKRELAYVEMPETFLPPDLPQVSRSAIRRPIGFDGDFFLDRRG